MCALFRDRKLEEENGNPAAAIFRRLKPSADPQRTAMWPLIDGLQAPRVWFLR